ncbi:hypothetical protein WA1_50150 [Scytonema hofmannii PCC 7110]|uniref:Uncharacterized protein n=1 Tax=Scytonema hofmannii PCC 7110 TaxID=128403 RepID=A0A139WR29_9CYAN|nr:hypothetical protein [Scytonema hofmannii]KYC34891.1 hypothetical protein WA1_50150 [Scytonema hofmannii PCC 7110]
MIEQQNLEQILTVCNTLPLDQKAELIKQLLEDSNVLFYFNKEQVVKILRAIADYITSDTR